MKKESEKDHEFISCDAFSLKNIENCARDILSKRKVIDVLVMSQGMATIQGYTPTSEGNDQKLTLHYWGRMAMLTQVHINSFVSSYIPLSPVSPFFFNFITSQLLPALRLSSDARVLSILSGGIHAAFANYEKDPELRNGSYSIKNAADAAGFYNDLGLDALAHDPKNKDIVFIHAAPGFVRTNWGTEMPFWIRYPVRALQVFGKSAEDCAESMVFGCVAPMEKSEVNEVRIMDQYTRRANTTNLHSAEASRFLWKRTIEVLERAGLTIPEN